MKAKSQELGKKKIVIIFSIVLFVCLLVGLSYAWLSQTVIGQKNLTVTVGDLDLILDESTSEGIVLKYAIPTEDADGQALDPYTFTVQNNSDVPASFRLSLEVDEEGLASCKKEAMVSCEPLDVNDIRYEMKENGVSKIGTLGETGFLMDGYLEKGEKNSYELRLWLDIDTGNEAEGKVYYGKLKLDATQTEERKTVSETLLASVGENGNVDTSDPDQTFITGTDPNNYIWYSGKLWRAVSIDPSDNSVKLVTQWNISGIPYNSSNNTAFAGSYMESWLNDTSVDGFLGNLRDYSRFIKTDSNWNATMTTATTKPAETTMVTDPVGLLNMYEYTMSYNGTTSTEGYLNNGLYWWLLTPYSASDVRAVASGSVSYYPSGKAIGIRPSINLKSGIRIVSGDGSENNPYRLEGDNDTNLNGTLLNTRYSGEYLTFGTGENTLYQIVSHETSGLTKIVAAASLKSDGQFLAQRFSGSVYYSSNSPIGNFLHGEYLTNYVGNTYASMIEDNTTWYLGTVGEGASYRLAKYTTATGNTFTDHTSAKVGLLRLGELMAGQFNRSDNVDYWILTPGDTTYVHFVGTRGYVGNDLPNSTNAIRPSFNLKSEVIITAGSGTKEDPFTIALNATV